MTTLVRGYKSRVARLGALAVAAACLTFWTASVSAADPVMGYDGSIPFDCELQQLGMGTDFPHPDADPFCVEYDKRHQNLTELGVVDFLAQEPARFAAAGPKCWYFQRDHWVGSVVQDDGSTQTYKWDGSYYFDKARGLGGVYIENFSINNQTGDPRELPGFPEEWRPYFGPGKGGVQTADTVRADPRCVAKAKTAPPPGPYRCPDQRGKVGQGIGPLRLSAKRGDVIAALGDPARSTNGVDRWCTADGGKLSAGFRRDRLVFALTTSPGFAANGFTPGDRSTKARRRLEKLDQRGGVALFVAASRKRLLLVGADRKRIRFIALAPARTRAKAINAWLDASR
ncbi:MAG: hypothetical protein ACJ8DU_14665 [Microvirga sp.]